MTRLLRVAIVAYVAIAGAAPGVRAATTSTGPTFGGPARAATPVDPTALYNAGNAAYRAERYAEAVDFYGRAIGAGAADGAVYCNLGNAYFRLGRIGRAILNYERSIRLDPSNDDARYNLRFAASLTSDRIEAELPEMRLAEALRGTLGTIPADWLAMAAFIGLAGVCFMGARWILGARRSAASIAAFALAAALLVGSAGIAGAQRWVSDVGSAAIVTAGEVEVRFEPGADAKVAFVLHEGTKAWVERQENGWALVQIANGLRGWVQERDIERI